MPRTRPHFTLDAPNALSPIPRGRTTAEQVEERLILAIARGDKQAGERITEAEIAQAMDVSRVPAREAMQKLEVRGVLVGGDYRGLKVADYSPRRIAELLELRLAIEKIIFLHMMAPAQDRAPLLDDLEQIVKRMADLSDSGDPYALGKIDLEFHRTIARHSGNEFALQVWEGLAQHMLIVFCRDWGDAFDRTGEVSLHRQVIDFLKHGRPEEIEHALLTHFSPPAARLDGQD